MAWRSWWRPGDGGRSWTGAKALDRFVLELVRRRRQARESDVAISGLRGPEEAPESSVLGPTSAHSALTRRRRGPVAKAAVALILSGAAFSAGMGYAGERAAERVAETEVFYQTQLQEQSAAHDALDVCLAQAEASGDGGYWGGQLAELNEDPRLVECRAEEQLRAARIRAEAKDRSFRSDP